MKSASTGLAEYASSLACSGYGRPASTSKVAAPSHASMTPSTAEEDVDRVSAGAQPQVLDRKRQVVRAIGVEPGASEP